MQIFENVELKPWQDLWNKNFNLECERITQWLSNNNLSAKIYHIGSTAVRGMRARPIIDILVCPENGIPLRTVVENMERAGYVCYHEHQSPSWYEMALGDKENQTYFLYICYEASQVSQDQLIFRSILQSSYMVRGHYMSLKRFLAHTYSDDYKTYQMIKKNYINSICATYDFACKKMTEETNMEEY